MKLTTGDSVSQIKKLSAIPLFCALLIGQVIFPLTGWMMARVTGITEAGAATDLMNQYAFGGFSIIAAIVLVVSYFAVNDSGLYGAITGMENIKVFPRRKLVSCLAIGCAIAAFYLSSCPNAFELVSAVSSCTLPSATVIMLCEYFWFKRKMDVKEVFSVPRFEELPAIQHSALWALIAGFSVGIITSGIIPGLQSLHVGICSIQAWLTCGTVYVVLRSTELALIERRTQRLESQLEF